MIEIAAHGLWSYPASGTKPRCSACAFAVTEARSFDNWRDIIARREIYLIAVRAVNGNRRAHQRSPGARDAFLPLLPHGHEALQHAATVINVVSVAMNNPAQSDRILRLRTVLDRTGLTRSTLYRKVAEGSFPRQVAISRRCVGWRASDLDAWLRNPMFFHVDDQ